MVERLIWDQEARRFKSCRSDFNFKTHEIKFQKQLTLCYIDNMSQRKCKMCEEVKPITEFASAGTVNGVDYYRYKCIACYSKFKQIRKSKIRNQYYDLKKYLKCSRCGNEDYRVLDFDHKDRSKKSFCIGYAMSKGYGIEKIKKEIKKCQVLCANCHRIKTWESSDYLGVAQLG